MLNKNLMVTGLLGIGCGVAVSRISQPWIAVIIIVIFISLMMKMAEIKDVK